MPVAKNLVVAAANKSGAVLLPDNLQWTNRVQIRSASSSRLYTVAQHKTNEEWGCSCMGYIRWRKCKHLAVFLPAVKALGGKV